MEIIFDAIPPVSCITGYYDNHHKNIGQIQQQQRSNVSLTHNINFQTS